MASDMGKEDDRISKLPDSILSHILSSLPIKDAVSTSILSTRWRHLYAYMLNLDVDFRIFRYPPPLTVKSFTNFMDKMLFLHTEGRIEQFRLFNFKISGIDASRVCEWISAALCRGVKLMDLIFVPWGRNIPMLPTAVLFTCKTLVRLKLGFPFVMTVPSHVFLPNLNTLELQSIIFEDDDSVKRLLSSCPILEQLSFSNCDMRNITWLIISNPSLKSLTLVVKGIYSYFPAFFSNEVDIAFDLPNLVYFKYKVFTAKRYSMGNMPCLVTADFDISFGLLPISVPQTICCISKPASPGT
ncbi:hypothetical protein V6N13_134147 [Hibiscus sabdariffa]|uniref:F-box domain-containing protein n=2 Tax=Hibiscus sabdariffa TaxID=183260 RepID=A0ABR2A146_9ROSI